MAHSPKQSHYKNYINSTWCRKIVAWILLFLTTTQPILVSAEVIADSKAPAQNKPAVESSVSGIPVVQITTPSAAGVSHNKYQQFSVDPSGLILNNSRVVTQTQLAGYITGNPNLANGSARIILNEVTSSNPSYLRGYTEVAGQKAEVIIANPNGIYGDGFGFINTSRAILTTGTPVFGGTGSLDAFRVTGGQIVIQGKGMNASDVDQVDLISRSVAINAGLWAKNINVVTGSNKVDYNTLHTETIAGDANTSLVAIDIGQLGGMYAQKIYLVGTENGVGVNSKGTIAAQAGDITITSAGKVLLTGNTSATGNIRITAEGDITNQDKLYSRGALTLIGDRIYNQGSKALIASTEQDVKLFAKSALENRDGAVIYSAGNLQIAGSEKQVNGNYVDKTKIILNQSATMEAEKDILLFAADITNRKRIFNTTVTQVADIAGPGICEGDRGHVHHSYYCDQHKGGPDTAILVTPPGQTPRGYLVRDVITETKVAEDSPEGKINAGHNITIRANTFTNDLSQILAGATLDASVGTLTNTSVTLSRIHNRTLGMELESEHLDNLHLASDKVVEQLPSYASIFGGGKQVNIQAGTITNDNKGMAGNPAGQTKTIDPTLLQNSLYSVSKESTSKYLIETNPAFTEYKKFISSDYMLTNLGIQPEKTQKRLGDGFYEQKLVQEQIAQLTGRRFLGSNTSNEEVYKYLLTNGTKYAKEFGLTVGVSLTAEQMDQLTTDMVWLVEKEVEGEKVLYPEVYLAKTRASDLKPSGALITADTVQIQATNIKNSGELRAAGVIDISGTTILNRGGNINANTLNIAAKQDLQIQGGTIVATENAKLSAGRNLTIDTLEQKDRTVNSINSSTYVREKTTNLTSKIKAGGNITLQAENDVNLRGAQVTAQKDLQISAAGNVTVDAAKDQIQDAFNESYKGGNIKYQGEHETIIGSKLSAQGNVTINAGKEDKASGALLLKGSSITSQNGAVDIKSTQGITIEEEKEKHENQTDIRYTRKGLLSSKTTEIHDYTTFNEVKGSTISGNQVTVQAGTDITVKGSSVVGTNDVSLTAKGDVNLTSAKETGKDEHFREEKTSGIFSGGGLGFTIGSKSEKTTSTDKTLDQVGSTIGSTNGNVTVTAGNQVASAGATFVAGKDINITGKDVTIDNTVNTVDSQTKYEFKQSGLTVSLGGGIVSNATNAAGDIRRSSQVEDERLKALYDYKAAQDIKKLGESKGNLKKDVSISVSIGSSQMTSEQTSHTETVNASNINAGGNVNVTANTGDINLKATNMNATDITLDAAKNINIDGAQNIQQTTSNTSSSSWSVGGTIGTGFSANVSKGSGNENENATTNTGSVITASNTLTLKSGNDTNITGSKVKGDKVAADIGGNLNIASKQDTDNFAANDKNSGFGISTGPTGGVTGSISKGKTDSNYASVTNQAGIFAGKGGFDITVGKNTDLKGAVIASTATPDKNKLSTDTLTYSDIQNKADYSSSSIGVNVNTSKDAKLNEKGITPNIGVPASGNADSTTKSAVANGTIEIRSNPNQDISKLSRDPSSSLNALGKIFDKKTVQEQQELAKVFGELAYEQVHIISSNAKKAAKDELDAAKKNGASKSELDSLQAKVDAWSEGGANKIALHAFVGGVMADLGGSNALSGAVGAGVNEAVQGELAKRFKDNPDMHQWASAIVGAAAAKAVGGNVQTGASTAASGTKNNKLNDYDITRFKQELMTALANDASAEAIQEIVARYKTLAMNERSSLDDATNKTVSFFGTTLKTGYSRELNDDAKQFLKDQIGFDWNAAFATIKSYNPKATDADVWDNLYDHVKANEGAISWRANQNKGELIAASGPIKGDTLLSLGKVSSINWGADGIARSVNDQNGNSHSLETPLSRGDYEYQKNGVEPFPSKENNMWYVRTGNGDYPVYGLGTVGDYYAKKGYPVELGNDGGHYTKAPDGSSWYTSAELTSVREQTRENYKKTIDDNDVLILALGGARDAGIGLNKAINRNVTPIVEGAGNAVKLGSNFESHLTTVEGFTQKNGISGGHNETAFSNYFKDSNIPVNIVNKTQNPAIEGIYNIEYQVGALDYTGKKYVEGAFKNDILKKTVYDPTKISDSQMTNWAKEAMNEGISATRIFTQKNGTVVVEGVANNGLKFRGYKDPVTGNITNAYPYF